MANADSSVSTLTTAKALRNPVEASVPLEAWQFICVSQTMDELLYAAEGIKELGQIMFTVENESDNEHKTSYLVESMGKYVQKLRNQVAEELEPIYKAFGVETIGY